MAWLMRTININCCSTGNPEIKGLQAAAKVEVLKQQIINTAVFLKPIFECVLIYLVLIRRIRLAHQ